MGYFDVKRGISESSQLAFCSHGYIPVFVARYLKFIPIKSEMYLLITLIPTVQKTSKCISI